MRWVNPNLHFGLYIYAMEVKLENGQVKAFQRLLEVE